MLVTDIPKYWVYGKKTNIENGIYSLPMEYNITLWRKLMACLNCETKCKQNRNRRRFLRKTPYCLVSFLFAIRFFQCGKKFYGACEKFFKVKFNPKGENR